MLRQFELVEKVKSYDSQADEDLLNRAYVYAIKMHGSQKRASGDPYFSHPIEVAGILSDLRIDSESIVTGLLHDVVEDTDATIADVEAMFGGNVAKLVDGVTKLGRLEIRSERSKHAENFRKLLLAMSKDIRVLLVKLADRLHNMRTLHYIGKLEKRQWIARETLEIYAPLAERIGMQHFQEELQDLAFSHLQPEAHRSIVRRRAFLLGQGGDLTEAVIDDLGKTLKREEVEARIFGRVKSPYSIWNKMQRKNMQFEQLSDIMAFRVIVGTVGECYHALGALHGQYPVVPGRFKDYISTPKSNGYRSLHTGLMGPRGRRIEVQIRTREMDEVGEYGVAAHWSYKQGIDLDDRQYRWVRELLDILEHAPTLEEFLEHTKLEMFQDRVFCFTPKGELIALPRGASPVDFAYAVHSEVGDTCVGTKVNGRMVPFRTKLKNGDQVEIVTSKAQTPSPDWESFVVTGKAKARIRRHRQLKERDQHAALGRQMLARLFHQEGYELTEKALEGVIKKLKQDSVGDLAVAVGLSNVTAREVLVSVYPNARAPVRDKSRAAPSPMQRKPVSTNSNALPINGLIPGMAVHFAHCCHPLPDDRIVGIVTTGRGVTVHSIDCETLQAFETEPERWIDISWNVPEAEQRFRGRIKAVITNEPGSLGNLTTIIGKAHGNIANLKITNRTMDFFELFVDVEVSGLKHLTDITATLRAAPSVTYVERARG
ncbi:MAG: bifunctional (p)ppGpp synthetase/guanosine-3',5'-bis(diphosphate) 3'-pyrophosphohydrolase [Rhodospirillales bacterium]|nr:bifunctional (p)ppGpp synthetase/guanosine-3',5'-bis(diphosphate) 3'-pyrophosphohydrolase [Rhodospirillales bacterium]